jgi:hypothetical protein
MITVKTDVFEELIAAKQIKKFYAFMELQCSWPCSQEHTT